MIQQAVINSISACTDQMSLSGSTLPDTISIQGVMSDMSRRFFILIVCGLCLTSLLFGCGCKSTDTAMAALEITISPQTDVSPEQGTTASTSASPFDTEAAAPEQRDPDIEPDAEPENQAEDAAGLVFPNPRSEQFDLSEQDAVLFDAAVAARNRTPNSDICIPEIAVYGTYEEDGHTALVCQVCYHFYYGCDGTEYYSDLGGMQVAAKAVLARDSDGVLQCLSFTLPPDGAGSSVWAEDFCGPLTTLRDYFLSHDPDETWPLTSTMPTSEDLFRTYIQTYQNLNGDVSV